MKAVATRLVACGLLFVSIGAATHDLDLRVQVVDGVQLEGQLVYSDGGPAGGNYIRVQDLVDKRYSTLALQTGEDGSFRLAGTPGHRYAVTAEGDEGHSMTVEITLAQSTPLALHHDEEDGGHVPVYLIIGALLLLSLIPARLLRKR
ncbi:MAG: hypothetical protein ACK5HY_05510 [Parahaliea sp.]